jgi:putative SOS response-associated peptidase YedK
MCGRFTIKSPLKELVDEFDIDDLAPGLEPRWNVAPTQTAPIVRVEEGKRRLALLRWGLVPGWATDLKIGHRMINARSETAATQPAFRKAFARRRCLVLADGFYEWRKEGKARLPLHIRRPDGRPFAMAGLWERWRPQDGPPLETCCVLTTASNGPIASVHDRMPALLLERDAVRRWLDADAAQDDLQALLRPAPDDALALVPVNAFVNDVRNEGARCLDPPEPAGSSKPRGQLEHFG